MRRSYEKGSSPLTRGAHRTMPKIRTTHGLIPAHAGSTKRTCKTTPQGGAHPRSRGEHGGLPLRQLFARGSSPLTRGALRCVRKVLPFLGLIPAHAGSTKRTCKTTPQGGAHPRSRGEHNNDAIQDAKLMGSSPLTRGAPRSFCRSPSRVGLIPAHAGSTVEAKPDPWEQRAHPRSRGEHSPKEDTLTFKQGSSPLTRGAPHRRDSSYGVNGLIPAHAGSTSPPLLPS